MRPSLRHILTPRGIPQQGLVGQWDLWTGNILLQSNNFGTGWTGARTTAVQSAATYTPNGSLAWKLVEDSTAGNTHYLYQVPALMASTSYTLAVKVKPAERAHVAIQIDEKSAGAGQGYYFHLHDGGSRGGAIGSPTNGGIAALDDGWFLVWISMNTGTGTQPTWIYLRLCNDTPNITFDGTGTSPYTEADPGLYIADAQLYPSSYLPPYTPNTTLQSWPCLKPYGGPTLQRGSSANADTNDPTVLGTGMGFVTDDYLVSGALAGVTMAVDWTAVLAGLFNGSSGYLLSLYKDTNNRQYFGYNGSGNVRTNGKATSYGTDSANLTVPTSSPVALAIRKTATTQALIRLDSGVSVSTAPVVPTGTPILAIASSGEGGAASALTAYEVLLYSRALSTQELQQIRRALKTKWASRNVSIL